MNLSLYEWYELIRWAFKCLTFKQLLNTSTSTGFGIKIVFSI